MYQFKQDPTLHYARYEFCNLNILGRRIVPTVTGAVQLPTGPTAAKWCSRAG